MKKPLSILLMTLFIAGCSGNDDTNDTPDTEEQTEEATTEEAVEVTSEEPSEEASDETAQDNMGSQAEESEEEVTEETETESMDEPTEEGAGGSVSGPYEQDRVTHLTAEDCIMSRLDPQYCNGLTLQQKFLAYHALAFRNKLPTSPNIGCFECMVDYSFAVMDGDQEYIQIPEMDGKGAPFMPGIQTFMISYANELANYFNGHPARLPEYIDRDSPAMTYLSNNRASGNYADHTTHAVEIEDIEQMKSGLYEVRMFREYEHATSDGVSNSTVEYTVRKTSHAFEIIDFSAVEN
ncbi:hypothetical protein ACFOLA_10565 [Salinicoccus hispanicus]|uniref:Uncharacterized protein n=1 Tax=Salinicoccus hispanicus TaxID=157225 RepID=A0A6N8U295_9STAP|nr:hypothetical protein [Salinicoccus hispanicus]MXQ51086.1 hypothetical protein [Salinicoccus hispanicus]